MVEAQASDQALAQEAEDQAVYRREDVGLLNADGSQVVDVEDCLLYTSPSPRDRQKSRMPSSA